MNAHNQKSQATPELETRLSLNKSRGDFDLDPWIETQLALAPDSRLLELGAGTGGHLLKSAGRVGPSGSCAALDVSGSSLDLLCSRALEAGISVRRYWADMDDLAEPAFAPELSALTHVCAVYSLYYSNDVFSLVRAVARRLVPDGLFLVVGPGTGNNLEWYELLASAGSGVPDSVLAVSERFLEQSLLPAARSAFEYVTVSQADNHVRFRSPEELENYWRSNIYFDCARDAEVTRCIRRHFEARPDFVITKRISAYALRRPRPWR